MASRHAIILAAGSSSRMGRDKAALPWLNGMLLLPWLVETLHKCGWNPIAVIGPRTESFWRERLPGLNLQLNPCPELGKTTSVAAGLRALPKQHGPCLITAIDQPRPPEVYRTLAVQAGEHSILTPDYNGHRGHPIVIPSRYCEQLSSLEENTLGLRGFLDEHRAETSLLPFPIDWLRWDFNIPADYEKALAWFRSRQIES